MSLPDRKRNVSLIGFMGSGKTAVGREVAKRSKLLLVDFDAEIEARSGMNIAGIFARHGERHFRDLESDLLLEVAGREDQLLVPGGGIVSRRKNRKILRDSSLVIWFRVGLDEIMRRTGKKGEQESRPLLSGRRDEIAALLATRERYYRECDAVIDTDGKEIAEVTDEVMEAICQAGFVR